MSEESEVIEKYLTEMEKELVKYKAVVATLKEMKEEVEE